MIFLPLLKKNVCHKDFSSYWGLELNLLRKNLFCFSLRKLTICTVNDAYM